MNSLLDTNLLRWWADLVLLQFGHQLRIRTGNGLYNLGIDPTLDHYYNK